MFSATRAACCMLWVTMTIVYCDLELEDQVFDLRGGNRIERRGGLIHQHHFRIDGQRARNAQALLLAAGEAGAGFLLEVVFHFVPKRGLLQRALDDLIEHLAIAEPVEPQTSGHVVVDRHGGKGIGPLKHHADAAADLDRRGLLVDIRSPTRTVPVTRAMGLVSCMRFRQRTKVDLPQPEGPISAVAWFAGMFRLMFCSVWLVPYHAFRSDTSMPTPTSLPLSERRGRRHSEPARPRPR